MEAYHHFYQYCYYMNKAYTCSKMYKQYVNRATYHLRMHENLLDKDCKNTDTTVDNTQVAVISTVRIKNNLLDVEYPRVSHLNNPRAEKRINYKIKMLVDQMIFEQIPPGSLNTEITGRYKIPLNQQSLLSIRLENYSYTYPAAHGFTIVRSLTFDLNTGIIYNFSDLFIPESNYKDAINEIIEKQIEERQIPLINEFTGVTENQEYYLTPDSIVIYFQLYELAPYVYGILEFEIPYSDVEDYINPNGPIARLV